MADLGTYDFTWVRGTTSPLTMSFKINDVAIPYDDVRLSVYAGAVLAFKLTLVDNPGSGPGKVSEVGGSGSGVITFQPTAAQTRGLLLTKVPGSGGKNTYEVEIRDGSNEDVFIMGTIEAIGGLNDDEA
jgi:hypothetical protein